MNELQIFNNPEFGNVRTLNIDGEPWFVGKDVAEALGYSEPRSAISKKVDGDDRGVAKMETPSGIQEMTIINESGLHSLIFSSKLPSAKKFKRWVTSEVLPAIRKTGFYDMGQPATEAESTKYIDPYTALEAAKIIATMPDSKRQVINCLRHVVPDIDFDVTDVKTETDVKTSSTKKSLRYVKEGVDIDVNKLLLEIASQRISIPVLAKRANVSVKSVTGWIAGEHRPVLQNRINICVALGKDKDFLTPRRTRNVME